MPFALDELLQESRFLPFGIEGGHNQNFCLHDKHLLIMTLQKVVHTSRHD